MEPLKLYKFNRDVIFAANPPNGFTSQPGDTLRQLSHVAYKHSDGYSEHDLVLNHNGVADMLRHGWLSEIDEEDNVIPTVIAEVAPLPPPPPKAEPIDTLHPKPVLAGQVAEVKRVSGEAIDTLHPKPVNGIVTTPEAKKVEGPVIDTLHPKPFSPAPAPAPAPKVEVKKTAAPAPAPEPAKPVVQVKTATAPAKTVVQAKPEKVSAILETALDGNVDPEAGVNEVLSRVKRVVRK